MRGDYDKPNLGIRSEVGAVLGTIAVTALVWSPTLTNDSTAGGDGSRIMPFIVFARQVAHGFAAWNPFRNGGYPLSADPEQYWWVAPFVDPASSSSNLQLNAVCFATILILAVVSWIAGRRFGLSTVWATLAAVSLCASELTIEAVNNGRIAGLTSAAALVALAGILVGPRLRPYHYGLIVLCLAIILALSVYYVIVPGLMLLAFCLAQPRPLGISVQRHIVRQTVTAAAISTAALLLSAAVTLPLVWHAGNSYVSVGTLFHQPEIAKEPLDYARVLLPFVGAEPLFVSFLIVPGLVLAIAMGRSALRRLTPFLPVAVGAGVFMLMSVPGMGAGIQTLWAHLPVIAALRWFSIWGLALEIALVLAAVAGLQAAARAVSDLGPAPRAALGLWALGVIAMLATSADPKPQPFIAAAAIAMLLASAAYLIASTRPAWRHVHSERAILPVFAAALAVASIAYLEPELDPRAAANSVNPQYRVTNRPVYPNIEALLAGEAEPYFRYLRDFEDLLAVDARVRTLRSFSLYFPKGLAYELSYLSPRFDLSQTRPHWVNQLTCADFDPRAIDLLAVKYLACEGRMKPANLQDWQEIGSDDVGVQPHLFRRLSYRDGLRVFCKWRSEPLRDPLRARETVLAAFSERVLLIDPSTNPAIAADCLDETPPSITWLRSRPGKLLLRVAAAQQGVLLLPDNYDSGWSASVNGLTRPVLRAYGALMALQIERGDNLIRMSYVDRSQKIGLVISALTAAGMLLLLFLPQCRGWRSRLAGLNRRDCPHAANASRSSEAAHGRRR